MNAMPQTREISTALDRALMRACTMPTRLRTLALSLVSHRALLRSTGPLGAFDHDPKARDENRRAIHMTLQTAIISSGLMLGIVRRNGNGYEVLP